MIDALLFVEVDKKMNFFVSRLKMKGCYVSDYKIEIKEGKYLSFYGMLFCLSLGLYKHEAERLISQIEEFKNKKEERKIFTFFQKK